MKRGGNMPTSTATQPKKPITVRFSDIIRVAKYSGGAVLETPSAMTPERLLPMLSKSTPIPMHCEYCGAEFTPRRASDKRRFCSTACASYWQTERLANMDPSERFWQRVNIAGPDDCWEWKQSRSRFGYGLVWQPVMGQLKFRWEKSEDVA